MGRPIVRTCCCKGCEEISTKVLPYTSHMLVQTLSRPIGARDSQGSARLLTAGA